MLGPRIRQDLAVSAADCERYGIANRVVPAADLSATVDELASRCLEGETGARAVDQLLRGSLLPQLSREILQRFATGKVPPRVQVGLSAAKDWQIDFAEA